jgi:oligopeptidase A
MDTLIDYASITPNHVSQAIEQLLAKARTAIDVAADPSLAPSWDAIVTPLMLTGSN